MGLTRHVYIVNSRWRSFVLLEPYPTGCVMRFKLTGHNEERWEKHCFTSLAQAKVYLAERNGISLKAWMPVLDASLFDRKQLHRSRYDAAVYGAQGLMRQGLFIYAVKLYRLETKMPLREAKNSCDHIRDVLTVNHLYVRQK